ncbi:MAG: hypothetical protein AB8G23_19855 [Myxococcota bacterium]
MDLSESNLRTLVRPFAPLSPGAEDHYDAVVRRVNRVRARRARQQKELRDLEDQFIQNDLVVRSGSRRGLPLSARGRRQRLTRMLDLSQTVRRLDEEERFAMQNLDRMNAALDRWAKETYGP